jgi:hypothetical protein
MRWRDTRQGPNSVENLGILEGIYHLSCLASVLYVMRGLGPS